MSWSCRLSGQVPKLGQPLFLSARQTLFLYAILELALKCDVRVISHMAWLVCLLGDAGTTYRHGTYSAVVLGELWLLNLLRVSWFDDFL